MTLVMDHFPICLKGTHRKKGITHEQIGKQIILKSEIGDIISKTTDKKKINSLAVGEGENNLKMK